MTTETDRSSGQMPTNGRELAAADRPRRARRWWWLLAVFALLLGLTVALFILRAVEYQGVRAHLDAAAAAFTGAREADAREYAPDKWLLATSRMDEAMAELHRQEGRFVLIRSYPRVHELLVRAIDAAEVATTTAEAARKVEEDERRQQAGTGHNETWGVGAVAPGKQEAYNAVNAAKASLDATLTLFARIQRCPRAGRAREVKNDLQTVYRNLDSYRKQVTELDSRYAYEDFAGAKAQAETLKGVLEPLAKDLEMILTKFKCK